MNNYDLILFDNGDIEIVKYVICGMKVVYRKSYNPSDDLKENLIIAYQEWEKLNNGR